MFFLSSNEAAVRMHTQDKAADGRAHGRCVKAWTTHAWTHAPLEQQSVKIGTQHVKQVAQQRLSMTPRTGKATPVSGGTFAQPERRRERGETKAADDCEVGHCFSALSLMSSLRASHNTHLDSAAKPTATSNVKASTQRL